MKTNIDRRDFISTASTAVTVTSGTQTFAGNLTLAASTSLDIGSNTLRLESSAILDVDAGTFTAGSGTVTYASATDPESQTDAITVGTLEIDKGVSTNTFDNSGGEVTFTNLTLTSGEYTNGTTLLDINGNFTNAGTFAGIYTG